MVGLKLRAYSSPSCASRLPTARNSYDAMRRPCAATTFLAFATVSDAIPPPFVAGPSSTAAFLHLPFLGCDMQFQRMAIQNHGKPLLCLAFARPFVSTLFLGYPTLCKPTAWPSCALPLQRLPGPCNSFARLDIATPSRYFVSLSLRLAVCCLSLPLQYSSLSTT